MRSLIMLLSLAGLVIPVLLTLLWNLLEQYPHADLSIGRVLENIQLLVWPSSLFMMATAGYKGTDYGMLTISIAVNILFYVLIGSLIWWGFNKQRWVLYLTIGLLILIWYKVLTL